MQNTRDWCRTIMDSSTTAGANTPSQRSSTIGERVKKLKVAQIWFVLALYIVVTIVTVPFVTIDKTDENRKDTKVAIEGAIDTLYFVVVMLSTVGYGDLSPVTVTGKAFIVVYAFLGIVLVSVALGVWNIEKMKYEWSKVAEAKRGAGDMVLQLFDPDVTPEEASCGTSAVAPGGRGYQAVATAEQQKRVSFAADARTHNGGSLARVSATTPSAQSFFGVKLGLGAQIARALAPMVIFLCWSAFLISSLEGWDALDAFYFIFTTSSTVGYGDLRPTTMPSKVFVIFFIPIGLGFMGLMVQSISDVFMRDMTKRVHDEILGHRLDSKQLALMRTARDGRITELEFTQYMLLAMGKVERHTLDAIHRQFNDLDILAKGYVDEATLATLKQKGSRKSLLWLPDEALLGAHEFGMFVDNSGTVINEHDVPNVDGEEGTVLLPDRASHIDVDSSF